jgi:hypothetical protein
MGTHGTVNQAPIDLPEELLIKIVLLACDATPAIGATDAQLRCHGMMRGIGSVSSLWRGHYGCVEVRSCQSNHSRSLRKSGTASGSR